MINLITRVVSINQFTVIFLRRGDNAIVFVGVIQTPISRCIYTLKDLGHFSIQCFLNGFKQRYPRRIRLKKRYPRRIRLKKRYPRRIRLKNECSYPGFIFIGGRTQSLALLSFYLNNYRLSLNSLCGYPSFTFYIQFLESYKNFFYYFVLSGPNS